MPVLDARRELVAAELGAGVSGSVPGRSLGRGLGFVNQIILARLLGVQVFGLYSIGWSLLRALALLTPIGMDAAVMRYGSAHWPEDRGRIRTILKQTLWLGAVWGVVVGAAFDFLSGTKPQAPRWMQRSGLEWLFRFAAEPRRLWPRYRQYPRFVFLALARLLGLRQYPDA